MKITAEQAASSIRPLLELAKTAYGSQPPGSPARVASEEVNAWLLTYVDGGGGVPELARELEGDLSLSGIRRRIRIARGVDHAYLAGEPQVVGKVKRAQGSKDPDKIKSAVAAISEARKIRGKAYGDAVRKAYDDGLSLKAIADELGISYYSLWSAKRTSW